MATANPFDLLGDDDSYDVSQLAAKIVAPSAVVQPKKGVQAAAQPAKSAKLPTKPAPPSQAVKEGGRGGGRRGGRGYGGEDRGGYGGEGRGYGGRGGRGGGGGGYNRERGIEENTNGFSGGGYSKPEEGDRNMSERRGGGYGGPRGGYRGGRRSNGDDAEGERPRRTFDRHSGSGRGSDFKRDGAGRGNWGTPTDEIALEAEPGTEAEKDVDAEKKVVENEASDAVKENAEEEPKKEEEPEDKEMTLEEYEKVLEEKRKALDALKTEERKVVVDKELKSMQQLSSKKTNDEIFIKLGSEKSKREAAEKEERAKKVSINEFLNPAEGESQRYGGRGRGRGGRGSRGGYSGEGHGGHHSSYSKPAPSISDTALFPSLGGK